MQEISAEALAKEGEAAPVVRLVNVVLTFGLDRNPDLPGIPFALDVARNEEDRQVMRLFFSQDAAARPVIAPPGIPDDRLAALRRAFMAVEKDAEFMADADKSLLSIDLGDHAYMQKIVDMVATTPAAVAQELATLFESGHLRLSALDEELGRHRAQQDGGAQALVQHGVELGGGCGRDGE